MKRVALLLFAILAFAQARQLTVPFISPEPFDDSHIVATVGGVPAEVLSIRPMANGPFALALIDGTMVGVSPDASKEFYISLADSIEMGPSDRMMVVKSTGGLITSDWTGDGQQIKRAITEEYDLAAGSSYSPLTGSALKYVIHRFRDVQAERKIVVLIVDPSMGIDAWDESIIPELLKEKIVLLPVMVQGVGSVFQDLASQTGGKFLFIDEAYPYVNIRKSVDRVHNLIEAALNREQLITLRLPDGVKAKDTLTVRAGGKKVVNRWELSF